MNKSEYSQKPPNFLVNDITVTKFDLYISKRKKKTIRKRERLK